jgi:hypothetical protein
VSNPAIAGVWMAGPAFALRALAGVLVTCPTGKRDACVAGCGRGPLLPPPQTGLVTCPTGKQGCLPYANRPAACPTEGS